MVQAGRITYRTNKNNSQTKQTEMLNPYITKAVNEQKEYGANI